MEQFILAIDQGTTSTRALLIDKQGTIVANAHQQTVSYYPQPGWVEQDALQIWNSVLRTISQACTEKGIDAEQLAGVGIANQRETAVIWERASGLPIYPAIVWQSRQTSDICDDLFASGLEQGFRQRTGLLIDPYFSGTKVKWILDHVEGARERARKGELCFGTIDSWLIWQMTGGREHVTDVTNASRTLLYNIHDLGWDEWLLEQLDIPAQLLPRVGMSSEIYGYIAPEVLDQLGLSVSCKVPIGSAAGDQQAALFGQTCFEVGMAKNTYGTGCFLLKNTGKQAITSSHGLLTTIAWGLDGEITYALEGSIFAAGSAIQWLRDSLDVLDNAADSEELARSVEDTGGVYVVPAFVGLGAPHWDSAARGAVLGLTFGSGKAEIVRATLESLAYQTKDVVRAMEEDSGIALKKLRVDGGAVHNGFLMQYQSDMLDVEVELPLEHETTGLGAAYLAGLATGFWQSEEEIAALWQMDKRYVSQMAADKRDSLYEDWQKAVQTARTFK